MRRGLRGSIGKIAVLCLALLVAFGALGATYPLWFEPMYIESNICTGVWDRGGDCDGTRGFWNNWDSHNTYSQSKIEEWLVGIDAPSQWLGPTNVSDMETFFDAGTGKKHTMKDAFLAHYLATRLNAASGRLVTNTNRNFNPYDTKNYLGLGGNGTLVEIILAIESKYPTSPAEEPTRHQYEVMKNICDALNNRLISPWPFP